MALPSVSIDLSANRQKYSRGQQPYIKQGSVWDAQSVWRNGKCQVTEAGWERQPTGALISPADLEGSSQAGERAPTSTCHAFQTPDQRLPVS